MAKAKKEESKLWDSVRSVESFPEFNKLKALVFGPSGSGKSTLAARFKKPLIGLTEAQAVPAIQSANPDALIKMITDVEELGEFRQLLRDPELPNRVDAVVLDSLTDAQRILKEHYTARQTRRQDKTDMDTWGTIIDGTARLAREVRDLPVHVCVICLDAENQVDGLGLVHRPAVSGKRLPNDLAQYFNLVGFTHVAELDNGFRHQIMFRSDERYLTKTMEGIGGTEPQEPLLWVQKRFGGSLDKNSAKRVSEWKDLELIAEPVNNGETSEGSDPFSGI